MGFYQFLQYVWCRWFRVSMVSLPSWMRVAILRRGPPSSALIRFSSPLMVTNSTSLKLGKKRCSSSLRQAKMVKSSSSQTLRLMLRMLLVLLLSMYVTFLMFNSLFLWDLLELAFSKILCCYMQFNRLVLLNTGMCFWSLVFLSACRKGLTVTASCLLFTWQQKLEIHTSGWVITAWVHLPPSTTFTSRYLSSTLAYSMNLNYMFGSFVYLYH